MLTVTLTPTESCIYTTPGYFNYGFDDSWLEDPVVKQMVLDVDKTELIGPYLCISPVLGPITCRELSGGAKGLIMILKDKEHREYSSTIFGDNCVPWLTKLSFLTDYTIVMEHSLEFYNEQEAISVITQEGTTITNQREVWRWYVRNSANS